MNSFLFVWLITNLHMIRSSRQRTGMMNVQGPGLALFSFGTTYIRWNLPYDEDKHSFQAVLRYYKDIELIKCSVGESRDFLFALVRFFKASPAFMHQRQARLFVKSCNLDYTCLQSLADLSSSGYYNIQIGSSSQIHSVNNLVDCYTNLGLIGLVLSRSSYIEFRHVELQFNYVNRLPPANLAEPAEEAEIIEGDIIYIAAIHAPTLQKFKVVDHGEHLDEMKESVLRALETRPAESEPLELSVESTQYTPLLSTGRNFYVTHRLLDLFNTKKLTRMDIRVVEDEDFNLLERALETISSSFHIQKIYLELSPLAEKEPWPQFYRFLDEVVEEAKKSLHPIDLRTHMIRPSLCSWTRIQSDKYTTNLKKIKDIAVSMKNKNLQNLVILLSAKLGRRWRHSLQILVIDVFRKLQTFLV